MRPHRELLRRLALDRGEIDGGRVVEVRGGLSDPHHGGRTVALVRFDSGRCVVYKPRPVGLEAAFTGLLDWWNATAGSPVLFAPRVLDRGEYGWMDFVTHEACAGRDAAGRYYERAGVLIALAALLDATDLHCGNVIAHGEHPVIVDLETLLHPRWPGEERSLLDTGLVPSWIRGPDGGRYDVSGFGAIAAQHYGGTPLALRENVVRIGDEIVSPAGFTENLLTGFRRAGELLISRREELVAPGGPLRAFRGQAVRVMLRHTETYRLGSGSLLRPVREPRVLEAVVASEREAMRNGDIPRFVADTGSAGWTPHPALTVPAYFPASSYDALVARTRRLEPAVVSEQAQLLSTALALWSLGGAMAAAGSDGGHRSGPEGAAPGVQQRHEGEVEHGGSGEQKQDETAHTRPVLL